MTYNGPYFTNGTTNCTVSSGSYNVSDVVRTAYWLDSATLMIDGMNFDEYVMRLADKVAEARVRDFMSRWAEKIVVDKVEIDTDAVQEFLNYCKGEST